MKYVQILASTFAFAASAVLLVKLHQQQGQNYLFMILFLLCGASLLARLTESSLCDQIAEAEEKVVKRVLRRLAKVMPELIDEYFKAQAAKPEQKLSDVIVAPLAANSTVQLGTMLASVSPKQNSSKGAASASQTLLSAPVNLDPKTGHVIP